MDNTDDMEGMNASPVMDPGARRPLMVQLACWMLASGESYVNVAAALGVQPGTVGRMMQSAPAKRYMGHLAGRVEREVMDPVRRRMEEFAGQAAEELEFLAMNAQSERLRADILNRILDRCGYMPKKETQEEVRAPRIVVGAVNVHLSEAVHAVQGVMGVDAEWEAIEAELLHATEADYGDGRYQADGNEANGAEDFPQTALEDYSGAERGRNGAGHGSGEEDGTGGIQRAGQSGEAGGIGKQSFQRRESYRVSVGMAEE